LVALPRKDRFVVREVAKELETIGALAKNRNTFK
jgi:hypothetical protein